MRALCSALGIATLLLVSGCFTVGDDDAADDDDGGSGGSGASGGKGGSSGGTGGTGGSSASGGTGGSMQCRAANADCTDDVESCCNGTTCVSPADAPTTGVCATNCLQPSDCVSGCCVQLTNLTTAVCAPADYCACLTPGTSCLDNVEGCCTDSTCVETVDETVCAANCTDNSECNSGCCAPLSNSTTRVCSPATFCEP